MSCLFGVSSSLKLPNYQITTNKVQMWGCEPVRCPQEDAAADMRTLSPRRQMKNRVMIVKLKDNPSISLLEMLKKNNPKNKRAGNESESCSYILTCSSPLSGSSPATAVSLEQHRPPSLHRGHPQTQNALFAWAVYILYLKEQQVNESG